MVRRPKGCEHLPQRTTPQRPTMKGKKNFVLDYSYGFPIPAIEINKKVERDRTIQGFPHSERCNLAPLGLRHSAAPSIRPADPVPIGTLPGCSAKVMPPNLVKAGRGVQGRREAMDTVCCTNLLVPFLNKTPSNVAKIVRHVTIFVDWRFQVCPVRTVRDPPDVIGAQYRLACQRPMADSQFHNRGPSRIRCRGKAYRKSLWGSITDKRVST